jgi:hypothetical protein
MLIGFITHRLKCNRTLPCDSSIKRDKVSWCQYAANVSRSKPGTAKARDLKDRLDTLETVVYSFLSRDGTVHSQIERNLEPPREDNRYDIASDKRRDESIQGLPSRQDIPTLEAPHLQEAENG